MCGSTIVEVRGGCGSWLPFHLVVAWTLQQPWHSRGAVDELGSHDHCIGEARAQFRLWFADVVSFTIEPSGRSVEASARLIFEDLFPFSIKMLLH